MATKMKPKNNEAKQDFLKRCTDQAVAGGTDSKKAFAQCNIAWEDAHGERAAMSLSAPVELKESKQDSEKKSFLISAYTGAKVERWRDIIIDVKGIQTKKKFPILREHARDRVVGYGDAYKEDSQLFVSGVFSEITPDAIEVLALAIEGYPWQASISVRPTKVEWLENEKTKATVNGIEVTGPVEIWRESKVSEVSFVSLGADDNTAAIVMSEDCFNVDIINHQPNMEEKQMEITVAMLKKDHPEIVDEILATVNEDQLRADAAKAERERIQAIKALSMAGHEALVEKLMFDGATTAADAAVQILAAEKKVRTDFAANLAADGSTVVPAAVPPVTDTPADHVNDEAPIKDRAEAEWKKSKDLRAEFMDNFDAYLAFREADENGQVRILKK